MGMSLVNDLCSKCQNSVRGRLSYEYYREALFRDRNRKQERSSSGPDPQLAQKKLWIRAFHLGLVPVRLLLSSPRILLIIPTHRPNPESTLIKTSLALLYERPLGGRFDSVSIFYLCSLFLFCALSLLCVFHGIILY